MMRMSVLVGVLALCLLVVIGVVMQSVPITAQDRTEERLTALETQVAELETRVATLEGNEPATTLTPSAQHAEAGALSISGVGSTVTDEFQLDAGRYEVSLTLDSGCCITTLLFGRDGSEDLLFNEIFDFDEGGGTVTNIHQIGTPGTYFLDVQNTDGAWTVTFTPR